eukprot:15123688-Ditylum_brightwellii.AAC.1
MGEHMYQVILGMTDLRKLDIDFDLDNNLRGFWKQDNIDAFWNEVNKNRLGIRQKQKPKFEYCGTVLEGSKYEAPNLEAKVS